MLQFVGSTLTTGSSERKCLRAISVTGFGKVAKRSTLARDGRHTGCVEAGRLSFSSKEWRCRRSCSEYLRSGEATLALENYKYPADAWQKAERLAGVGENIFKELPSDCFTMVQQFEVSTKI